MHMTAEDLEFSLSQYADGTLPDGERSAVEAVLAVDPAARAAVAAHRILHERLAVPPGDVNWDRLATFLSASVAEADLDAAVVVGRIGPSRWTSAWRIGSIAAAAVVAVSVGLLARRSHPTAVAVAPARPVSPAVAVVTGPAVEMGSGPVEAEVTIGPSPALAARGGSWRYAEGVVDRQPTAVIAAAQPMPGNDLRYR